MKRRLLGLFAVLLVVASCQASAATVPQPTPTFATPSARPSSSATATLSPSPSASPVVEFGQIARGHIVGLTGIGPRVEGSNAELQAANYVATAFRAAGYEPQTVPFTGTDDYRETVHSQNVVAFKAGSSTRQIIVGAHYDSVSAGLGADDNASGVGVMLEMATRLRSVQTPYTIRFVAFGAEEGGMVGSHAFVSQMSQADRSNTVAFVNLDSVTAGDFEYVYSAEGKAALRDWALAWASRNGIALQTIHNVDLVDPEGGGSSDYYDFERDGIAFLYFEATNWTLGYQDGYTQVDPRYGDAGEIWHTRYDTLAYLDATFPGRVDAHLRLVATVLYHVLIEYE